MIKCEVGREGGGDEEGLSGQIVSICKLSTAVVLIENTQTFAN